VNIKAIPASSLPSLGLAISVSGKGRMSFPVSPQVFIYSHFRHVSGVPAPEGSRGVALSKLKVLDVLIEQLGRRKDQGEVFLGNSSEEYIDALIEEYEQQIRSAQKAHAAMPYRRAPSVFRGAMFDLVA